MKNLGLLKGAMLLCLFVLSLNYGAFSQNTGSISGVVDDNSGKHIPFAAVVLEKTTFSATTDENGSYQIKNVPAGSYRLIISLVGYKPVKKDLFVKGKENVEYSFKLLENVTVLQSVEISGKRERGSVTKLPEIRGTDIYSGKKNEVILVGRVTADGAENNARQMFARVPGITSWELDGSGTQTSIASRGLSPHRSWEFNVNQNGYNVNNDLYGYPEAMYNPPIEAVHQIEIVRGSAALQYGPQFGGMLNYVIKKPDTTKVVGLESQQTYGSFNMMNSFNAIGGKKGKFTYHAYFNYRSGDGYRPNANYNFLNAYGSIHYKPTEKIDIGVEFSRENYVQKFAGALTDTAFARDPHQSTRSRNYLNPIINLPALIFDYAINEKTLLNVKAYSLIGERNMIIADPGLPSNGDTVNRGKDVPNTNWKSGYYKARELNKDHYNSYTVDARMIRKYNLFNHESALSGGVKYSSASTNRTQNGEGTAGTDFDLTQTAKFGTDILFKTVNFGAFLENLFRITNRLSITPGVRYDNLQSTLTGTLSKVYKDDRPLSLSTSRNILLGGVGAQFKIAEDVDIYGNYAGAYRPILYSTLLITGDTTSKIDPNMKDASGYNADIGIRGKIKNVLNFDVGVFLLYYGNRIGNVTMIDSKGKAYLYTTNIGNALTKGVEAFVEIHLLNFKTEHSNSDLSIFSSYSYNDAHYLDGKVGSIDKKTGLGTTVDVTGNVLEDAPKFVSRSGINCTVKNVSATFYYSAVGESFCDANNTGANTTVSNTVTAKTDPSIGLVPAYQVMDFALGYKFLGKYNIKGGINNLADYHYFTRRTETLVYLGKGILPGDGRSFYLSLGAKF